MLALGIDQGGSGTRALLLDRMGGAAGEGRAPGGAYVACGLERSAANVKEAAGRALAAAGATMADVGCAVAGMTGADWPHEYPLLESAVSRALGIPVMVVNDSLIALHAETAGPGVVVCAGTGMNCAARSARGETFVYGYYVRNSDQGGTALGRDTVWAVLDAHSGVGRSTTLVSPVLKACGYPDEDALLMAHLEGRIPPAASLVPVLYDAARQGDAVAHGIVCRFAQRCARYAAAALLCVGMDRHAVPAVLAGGVWRNGPDAMVGEFEAAIRETCPCIDVLVSHSPPVWGAEKMAMEQAE